MNIFYAPPSHIRNNIAELRGQEATHASRVLRAREGDTLVLVDGKGGRYRGPIRRITEDAVQVEIEETEKAGKPDPELKLGIGIIKKRDRLEFAVEKAVELGASGIALFRSRRTVKESIRMDRLESKALSAMKQSLRSWLPEIEDYSSLEKLLESCPDYTPLVAHEKIGSEEQEVALSDLGSGKYLLLVGPEGGFSDSEIEFLKSREAVLVSLGANRLRTETAAVAFLSQFLNCR